MPVSKIMPLILSGTSSGFWATTCNPYKIVYVPVLVSIVVIFLLLVIFGFYLFPNMRILYMEDGRQITVFRDMLDGAWYRQNA
jgi:hypothetical protein